MIKNSNYQYLPYIGPEKYIFLRSFSSDIKLSDELANSLVKNNIRLFYDCINSNNEASPEEIAAGILNSDLALFILSKQACDNLDFRNSINYALKEKKNVICIKDDNYIPSHGLDMQLANVETINKSNASEIIAKLEDYLNDDFIGEDLKFKPNDSKKKLSLILLGIAVTLFLIGAGFIVKNRIAYLNSAEYQLKDADGSEYLDITMFDEDALLALSGKSVDTLYMEGMDIKDISGISDLKVKSVNIAHNPNVSTLWYLTRCQGLQDVTISQDMLKYARDLLNKGIQVKVVK